MDITRHRLLFLGLALPLVIVAQDHASAETLNFVAKQYSLGGAVGPTSIVVQDFNRDGFLDVVTTNFSTDDISVLFGNHHGGFRDSRRFPVGDSPRSMAIGDFNSDGMEDLATANQGSDDVSVLFGKRAEWGFVFEKARSIQVDDAGGVAVGDFNRDGRLDLVVIDDIDLPLFTGHVSILLGRGNGQFRPAKSFPAGNPWSVAVDDFNRDGIEDLITADANPDNIAVLFGNADGSFQPPLLFPTGEFPIEIVLGDFNRDGAPDAVTVNEESRDISILFGNVDGNFHAPQPIFLFATSVAVGDFNRDGALDLSAIIVAPQDDRNVAVLLGNGDGSFHTPQYFSAREDGRGGANEIAVGDFNRDGALDIVTTVSGGISVLIQQTAQ